MYKNLKEVMKLADEYGFIVGSFNMHNLEMLPPMIRAAKEQGSPIIIQTSVSTADYIGMEVIVNVCKTIAETEAVDVALHLDHATSFEDIKRAIAAGYSSVMFDGSKLSLRDNIIQTKQVVDYAHLRGVSVEGELGTISGVEDEIFYSENNYTNPVDAKEFIEKTGVDALAVSIGTQHGSYKGKTEINIDLLKEINEVSACPLVIHGGTGVKESDIKYCSQYGVRKFNVGTELLVGWTRKAKEKFEQTEESVSLRNNIMPCNEVVYDVVTRKVKLFIGKDE